MDIDIAISINWMINDIFFGSRFFFLLRTPFETVPRGKKAARKFQYKRFVFSSTIFKQKIKFLYLFLQKILELFN